ncbi:Velvet domain-containing protein [Mycena indigotica]|uniref:Velvet domain-containing protein n=1 Tax=Mycena indigotica TaxID=2126181 RepID=A0A8H6SCX4_9AGAR|nr:Velvet domain-containing protein [Mycena indigotica]KAF7297230.1 Velvet domain-containing protein [Mycena indigotica]
MYSDPWSMSSLEEAAASPQSVAGPSYSQPTGNMRAASLSWAGDSAGHHQSQAFLPNLNALPPDSGDSEPPAVDEATTDFVGAAVHFTEGRFAGETIYAELEEIQRPEYGRRFGAVDRRVLDDPPVVELRLYQVSMDGEEPQYTEIDNYETVALAGMLCMVDLFEVPSTSPSPTSGSGSTPQAAPLTYIEGRPITESSKRTTSLFGATFVEAYLVQVPGEESKRLLFTFSDLAVRSEGQFVLRYRFFDLLARPTGHAHPTVLAECFGGVFTVYSTKSAPALKESTELTKSLARHNIPVNIRKKQRAPRRKVQSMSPSLSPGGGTS